jgi:hypothetical protein
MKMHVAGGKVPDDRIIDGIEMRDFFVGKADKSGRESVIVYSGNDLFGIKWRNWKMNFKEIETGRKDQLMQPERYWKHCDLEPVT